MLLGTLRTVYDFKIILGKKMKYDLSCIGSALVDITFEIDESFAEITLTDAAKNLIAIINCSLDIDVIIYTL